MLLSYQLGQHDHSTVLPGRPRVKLTNLGIPKHMLILNWMRNKTSHDAFRSSIGHQHMLLCPMHTSEQRSLSTKHQNYHNQLV